MNDVTELAQSLKAAAEKYKSVWGIARYSKAVEAREKFHELVTPANVIALVEELEKAQQERENWRTSFDNERFRADKLKAHIDEMTEEQTASINELSRIIQRETKMKREAEKRIAKLEFRTVTVKLPKLKMLEDYLAEVAIEERKQILVGVKLEFHRALADAGIKWEAE
ncbi:TPA: ead/Ea22-like family protein [Klebsiella pneumoniae]|nr:ead/Ea22-like family protein [Klebsiella pneumoniae]HDK7013888.1 hypothetical protein [Klebsiella pneumoniae]